MLTALDNLTHVLKKGEQWAEENKDSKESLIDGKIAEDMKVWRQTASQRGQTTNTENQ